MPFPNSKRPSFTVNESEAKEQLLLPREAVGIPCRTQRLSWVDIAAVVIVFYAATVAIAVVWEKAIAMLLGQTNQLVLLGLTMSIMALCTQRQVQKLTLLYEARFGASTLQNFDAILRTNYFATDMSWRPRFILWILLLLPLALGAAYKKFSGGSTDLVIHGPDAAFGITAAPGNQLIGNGLSLLSAVYLPFWMNPAINRTYGFNLYIPNNSTAAILDAPLPADLTSLQTSLQNDQSMTITTNVNATVTENINPSTSERNDVNYWQRVQALYPYNEHGLKEQEDIDNLYSGIWGEEETIPWTGA
ncbi:MAG: hypothetical protein LQ350_005031 [Teloschistes chrysophthalmus]|nr:MAG: hypothetical protein LQ350_005031 [Niorma chrysophthalma]